MSIVTPKTLSPSPFLRKPQNPNPNPKFRSFKPQVNQFHCICERQTERGIDFETGETFFRHESAKGRDLGVLAAALYKQSKGRLRVLDAMCGCGIRSCRYLLEAKADFVLANDANDEYRGVIVGNLKKVERGFGDARRWAVSHFDANRVLMECYLQRDFFDLIDIDSFGSGHRPYCSLAAYGAYVRPMPCSNEIGLRMLIGIMGSSATATNVEILDHFHGKLGQISCSCRSNKVCSPVTVSGPLWTGPLHSATFITEMLTLAEQWGWMGNSAGADLDKLLRRMLDESDPVYLLATLKWMRRAMLLVGRTLLPTQSRQIVPWRNA
ncbi:hypothetical protein GH714_008119 [Hevea brasiliensis]|uniref:tRNA (guanine(26)-N(2))-dimethyltransferase n=1 Tax=Hevea brasiliensis TaxID=3981 RepID=A0A6A6LZG4_HEVBR|nr:hypothetical protein GH714_008119 [Hevea brasiliensis]